MTLVPAARLCVVWARCTRFRRPQFVGAFGAGLVEGRTDVYAARRAELEAWFRALEDHDPTIEFFDTAESVILP